MAVSYRDWSANVRWRMPLSASIVTQLVTRPLDQTGPPCQRRTISLGMSAGSAVTSIAAGRRSLCLSVSVRETPW